MTFWGLINLNKMSATVVSRGGDLKSETRLNQMILKAKAVVGLELDSV